jgi:benzoate-CoA ligase
MSTTGTLTERYNVSSLVERQVEAGRGAKTAYVAADATLTYDELRRRVNRFGRLLAQLGVGREHRALLVLDDTTVFPTAFLGAMRMGAVPVPVSPLDKADNFRHYVDDSYARVVVCDLERLAMLQEILTGDELIFVVAGGGGPGVVELGAAMDAQEDELAPASTHRDDMAFWLYSSGSTGKPKGVVHLHHDIEVTCETFARQVLGLREDDVHLSTTKLYHAYGLGNSLSFPLWSGATTVLRSGPSRPAAILQTLREHRPTVFFSVPGLYGALVREPDADGALDSVRMCVSAAEPLPPQTFDRWRERFGLEIVDGIGSTEMLHIYCSNRPGAIEPGTTGRPVPGYELRIVDEDGVVIDGPGTGGLEVRGDSCAAYYWHQHEKTKRCMRGDWFSTGDRYERRADGAYVFVGRMDDMLKVGGLWASPVDMEHVLMEHPRVLGAGVVGVTVEDQSRIAAFVETDGDLGDDMLAEELRTLCKERLRRYEYPHIVEFVDALPRTLTGKVQRFRLRELADGG